MSKVLDEIMNHQELAEEDERGGAWRATLRGAIQQEERLCSVLASNTTQIVQLLIWLSEFCGKRAGGGVLRDLQILQWP